MKRYNEVKVYMKVGRESALHINFLRGIPKLAEDAQRVGEGRRAALDSIINVRGTTKVGVDIHGARHPACDVLLLKDNDNELVGML